MAQGGYVGPIPAGIGAAGGGAGAGGMFYAGDWAPGSYLEGATVSHAGGLYVATRKVDAGGMQLVGGGPAEFHSSYAGGNGNQPIPLPPGADVGDFAVLALHGSLVTSDIAPGGFTTQLSQYNPTADGNIAWSTCLIATKVLDGTDAGAGTVTPAAAPGSGHNAWSAQVWVFRNVSGTVGTGTIGAIATGTAFTTTPPAALTLDSVVLQGICFADTLYNTWSPAAPAPGVLLDYTVNGMVYDSGGSTRRGGIGYQSVASGAQAPAQTWAQGTGTHYTGYPTLWALPIITGDIPAAFKQIA